MSTEETYRIMRLCPLFAGLDDSEIAETMEYYGAKTQFYAKGDTLIGIGLPVDRFALVLSGSVQVMCDDINGSHMIMATVLPGQTFAESLCFRHTPESPVYACAVTSVEVMWLRTDCFTGGNCRNCMRFIAMLTQKTLAMNDRIQILSKLTLKDKLMTLLSQYALKYGPEFDLPFDRESLAVYLGVNRSALSRELARLKGEGTIEFERKHFKLK